MFRRVRAFLNSWNKRTINAVNFVQASSEAIEKVQELLNNDELGKVEGVDIFYNINNGQELGKWKQRLRFKASGGYIRSAITFHFVVERLLAKLR